MTGKEEKELEDYRRANREAITAIARKTEEHSVKIALIESKIGLISAVCGVAGSVVGGVLVKLIVK